MMTFGGGIVSVRCLVLRQTVVSPFRQLPVSPLYSVVSEDHQPQQPLSSQQQQEKQEEEQEQEGQPSSSTSPRLRRFMYMTTEQDIQLRQKGEFEQSLMQTPTPIQALNIAKLQSRKNSAPNGKATGFGGGVTTRTSPSNKKLKKGKATIPTSSTTTTKSMTQPQQPQQQYNHDPAVIQAILQTIQQDGLVRIDNVLSSDAADTLRDYLLELRHRATVAIEEGTVVDSQERFADVLLNQNRCDLKIPLGPKPVHQALLDVLTEPNKDNSQYNPSLVRTVIESVFDSYSTVPNRGKYASLWELNCFMSNAGARRQLVHADNVCLQPIPGLQDDGQEPILLTCFIALQDIDPTMGPTVWMPGTHTIDAHNRFFETGRDTSSTKTDTYSPKNDILQSSKAVLGAPIPKGACVIFDPRVLHCAGANHCADPTHTRALFYMSFKNPKIDNPGCPSTSGYGISTAELTMEQLVTDLTNQQQGRPMKYIPLIASNP
ncbi:phytanoyl-CoA dioxygenase family protein [Nitzschia inconspicua]|nr:phytanoyl-CoA dioxygenase family protein [Nitzschia inconspicua]